MKHKRPLVSIVISNYNGRALLKDCLESLNRLDYPNYEIIVVDAGSTDGSPAMVGKNFPYVKLVKRKNIGIGEALNIGIREAKGEIIVFDLNNDDVVSNDWLTHLVDVLISSEDVGIVCGKRYFGNSSKLDSAGGLWILGLTVARGHGKNDSEKYNVETDVDYVAVPAVKKEVFDKIGMLEERYFIYGEDVDFCLRAKKAGYRIVYVPEAVFWHKRSATVGFRSPKALCYGNRSRIRMIRKHSPNYRKVPLLLLHLTLIPFFYILYYTFLAKGNFIDYLKAELGAIRWGIKSD